MIKLLIVALGLISATLAIPGKEEEYHDPLLEDDENWRLAFRGTAGVGINVWDAYREYYANCLTCASCAQTDFHAQCDNHYRNNDALDKWWRVKEVLFGIVKDGAIVKHLRFNATGATYLNWLTPDRVINATYHDLKEEPKINWGAEFWMLSYSDSCEHYGGWFFTIEKGNDTCNLVHGDGKSTKYPVFKYAAGPNPVNWNAAEVNNADAFVIFLKYEDYGGEVSQYFDLFESGIKEYRLAFRATSGVGYPVLDAYESGRGISEDDLDGCITANWTLECNSHYRNNDALNNYKAEEIEEILFGVISDRAMVKYITFSPKSSNYKSWFKKANVIHGTWVDFSEPQGIFDFENKGKNKDRERVFFINRGKTTYCRRSTDFGWVVAIDNAPSTSCRWERGRTIPRLLYAAGTRAAAWGDEDKAHEAEAFVIFFKYKNMNKTH